MIKTITINTDTHCVVPKGMVYELPELPMPIKGKFSKDLFDGFQMHQYAMRYLDEAIAAAPQPEPVESEPNPNWCAGCSPDNCSGCRTGPVSKPDQTAELEQLRQQVADLEKERDDWQDEALGSRINVETLRVERDAALNEVRDFESDVDTVTQHNVELQLETIALKSALMVAKAALNDCEGALDECRDYPITYDTILEALTKINEVLK